MESRAFTMTVFLTVLLGFIAIPEGIVLSSESGKSTKDIAGFWRSGSGNIIEIDGDKAINVYIKEREYHKFISILFRGLEKTRCTIEQ